MSDIQAISLAREFRKIDRKYYANSDKLVQNYIENGYTPEEALMLSGIGGYEN